MNITKHRWLTETNEYKLIAWEHRRDVTIEDVPLEEALYQEHSLLQDASRWMNNADYNNLLNLRRSWILREVDAAFIEIDATNNNNQWTVSEEEVAASFPSGYYVPEEITIGAPERTDEMVSINDLRLYYSGTVNYADGKICRIIGANNKGMICSPLEGGKAFITKDLKPINDIVTGFVNTPVGCIKCFRKPTRTAKEGINTESIETGSTIPWDSYPNEFMDMLNNIYPSEEEAIRIAKEEHINVAVSKFKYYDWITAEFINILKKSNKERVRYELD